MAIAAQEQVNELLHDDVPDNGHVSRFRNYERAKTDRAYRC